MAVSGVARLRLLVDLKNNIKGKLGGLTKDVHGQFGNLNKSILNFKASNVAAFDAVKASVPGVGSALGMLANPYAAAAAAAVGLAVGLKKCVSAAMDWENAMAQVNVTAGLTKTELSDLSEYLKDIGTKFAVPLEDVPKAFQMIIGAVNDVSKSKELLVPVLQTTKAFASDLETVSEALSAVFGASGRSAEDVGNIIAQMSADGAAEFDQIAQFFPKIIPNARALGVSLEEVAGSYAALSGKLGARLSATSLDSLFGSLQSAETIKKFEKMKVNIFDKDGSMRDLQDIIGDLNGKLEGLTDKQRALKLDKLGLNETAAKAVLALSQNYQDMTKYIDSARNSTGALQNAYDTSLTSADRWLMIKNHLGKAMIDIGEFFLPILTEIGQKILDVINWFKAWWKESDNLRSIVQTAFQMIINIFKLAYIPILQIVNVVKLLKSKFSEMGEMFPGLRESFSNFAEYVGRVLKGIFGTLTGIFGIITDIVTFDFTNIPNRAKDIKKSWSPGSITALGKASQSTSSKKTENKSTDATATANKEDAEIIKKGSQTKVTNITFRNVVENWTTSNSDFSKMDRNEAERFLTDLLIRMSKSVEMT